MAAADLYSETWRWTVAPPGRESRTASTSDEHWLFTHSTLTSDDVITAVNEPAGVYDCTKHGITNVGTGFGNVQVGPGASIPPEAMVHPQDDRMGSPNF